MAARKQREGSLSDPPLLSWSHFLTTYAAADSLVCNPVMRTVPPDLILFQKPMYGYTSLWLRPLCYCCALNVKVEGPDIMKNCQWWVAEI